MYTDSYQLDGDFYNIQYYIVEAENNKLFNQCAYNLRINVYRTNFTVLNHEYHIPLVVSAGANISFTDRIFDIDVVMESYDDSQLRTVDIPFTTHLSADPCCNVEPVVPETIYLRFGKINRTIETIILLPEYIGFSLFNPQFSGEIPEINSYNLDLKITDWGDLPITAITKNEYYSADKWSKNYNGFTISDTPYSIDFQTTLETEDPQNRFEFIDQLKDTFNTYKGSHPDENRSCSILNSEPYQFLINFDWFQNLWYPCSIDDIINIKTKGSYIEGTFKFNLLNGYGVRKIVDQVSNTDFLDNVKPVKPLIYVYFKWADYVSNQYFIISEEVTNRRFKIDMNYIRKVVSKENAILKINMSCKTVEIASFDSVENKYAYNMPLVKDYETHDGNKVITNFAGLYQGSQGKHYSTEAAYHGTYHKLGKTVVGKYINNNIQALKKMYKGENLYQEDYFIDFPNDHDVSQNIPMTNDSKITEPVAHVDSIGLKPSKLTMTLKHSTTPYTEIPHNYIPDDSDWLVCFNNFELNLSSAGSIFVEYNGKM
jgi:hypothetical protein